MCMCVCMRIVWQARNRNRVQARAKQRDSNTAKQRRRPCSATTKNILAICRQLLNAFVRFVLFLLRARRPFEMYVQFSYSSLCRCCCCCVESCIYLFFMFLFSFGYIRLWLLILSLLLLLLLLCSCCCCGLDKNWQLTQSVTKIDIIRVVCVCVRIIFVNCKQNSSEPQTGQTACVQRAACY